MSALLHDRLAALFRYPPAGFLDEIDLCCQVLAETGQDLPAHIQSFAAALRALSPTGREELFTHTFDNNPLCSLEVGWQLFGEQYERGTFLVRMRQELRRLGLPESTELPDHLIHVLMILGRMEPERADDFATACVIPAVERMYAGLAGKDNPYAHALAAVRAFLFLRHGAAFAADAGAGARVAEMEE